MQYILIYICSIAVAMYQQHEDGGIHMHNGDRFTLEYKQIHASSIFFLFFFVFFLFHSFFCFSPHFGVRFSHESCHFCAANICPHVHKSGYIWSGIQYHGIYRFVESEIVVEFFLPRTAHMRAHQHRHNSLRWMDALGSSAAATVSSQYLSVRSTP